MPVHPPYFLWNDFLFFLRLLNQYDDYAEDADDEPEPEDLDKKDEGPEEDNQEAEVGHFLFYIIAFYLRQGHPSRFEIIDSRGEVKIPKEKRQTRPFLTKYERARILGARALQISLNAPVLVDVGDLTDPLQIADLVWTFSSLIMWCFLSFLNFH